MSLRPGNPIYADDATEGVSLLLRLRLPWLIAGLILGAATTVVVSHFEALIAADIRLTYFVPLVVYISDAVGTQTQTIYVRNLGKHRSLLRAYLLKEIILGVIIGLLFGAASAGFTLVWFQSTQLAATVGLAMATSIATATLIALLIPGLLSVERQDPAIGAGPVTTVIQDLVTIVIYFGIATAIIL